MVNLKNLTDSDLVVRIQNSDHKAFAVLYERFWESMYVKSFSILQDKNKAKDIVQEVWISVWERRNSIENNNIKGYLFTALRYKIYNEFRNANHKNVLIQDFIKFYQLDNSSNNTEDEINFNETQYLISSSVQKLPKKCKEVFELSRYDGLKNNEIAQKLSISQRTVETHISNALKFLKNNAALGFAFISHLF
jgi:RNA polymerase sigma-70 factor (ECF subfamily)